VSLFSTKHVPHRHPDVEGGLKPAAAQEKREVAEGAAFDTSTERDEAEGLSVSQETHLILVSSLFSTKHSPHRHPEEGGGVIPAAAQLKPVVAGVEVDFADSLDGMTSAENGDLTAWKSNLGRSFSATFCEAMRSTVCSPVLVVGLAIANSNLGSEDSGIPSTSVLACASTSVSPIEEAADEVGAAKKV